MVAIGCGLALAGVAVLRASWARRGRSGTMNLAGWMLGWAGLILGGIAAGAWGVAVVALAGMAAAAMVLSHAALTAPSGRKASVSSRRVNMLPQEGEPLHLTRRIVTFLIVAVLAMLASILLAVGARWLAAAAGVAEGNANVIALFAMPLGWTVLSYALLMTDSRKRQFTLLALTALPAIPAFLTGGAA